MISRAGSARKQTELKESFLACNVTKDSFNYIAAKHQYISHKQRCVHAQRLALLNDLTRA